jgi:enterochelin esterase family protein
MTPSKTTTEHDSASSNPIIQGTRATFFWKGDSAPALLSDLNSWTRPKQFKRVLRRRGADSDKSIWSCSLTLPRDAYLEYILHDPVTGENFLDSLNRQTVSNGMGKRNNYFYMPAAVPSPFAARRAEVPAGTLTHHRVRADYWQEDARRDVYLYKPPVDEAVPLLIVYDGYDYLQRGKLATIVDNLIAEKRIRPIAMAFLQNGRSRRTAEYFCSDATIHWLDFAILPLARKRLRLLDIRQHPGSYGVLGASAGGLMSMYTGLRMPEIFGKVLCQAGVFSLDGRDFVVKDLVRYGQGRGLQIWMDVGTLDELLDDSRRMIALLDKRQYNVAYREFSGGHNYTVWRNDLAGGLETLFGS